MCWKGYDLYGCSTEFRLFWLHGKLEECGYAGRVDRPLHGTGGSSVGGAPVGVRGGSMDPVPGTSSPPPSTVALQGQRRFAAVPAFQATPGGLHAAHADPLPFVRDGLYFIHREACYAPGPTPLALLWKDASSSSFFIDTDRSGQPQPQQLVTLSYRMDATVATSDDPPVVLGRMPPAFVQQLGPRLRPGAMLRFALGDGGVAFDADGKPVGADLHFRGPAGSRRGRADSLSKVLFQYLARRSPISLERLVAESAAGMGGEEEGNGGRGAMETDQQHGQQLQQQQHEHQGLQTGMGWLTGGVT
jgi:snurportin-1